MSELTRLGVGDWTVVISTNIELRRDGLPYAGRTPMGSPGVVVYFQLDSASQVFACDKWSRVEDNMRAIGLTIQALRGIERWGSGEMMRRAFSGFKALPPPPGEETWRSVFGLGDDATLDDVDEKFATLALQFHPDLGGDPGEMVRINLARAIATKELGA